MKRATLFGMVALALAGCGQEPQPAGPPAGTEEDAPAFLALNKHSDQELHLLTRVMLSRTHAVEFYETTPGQIVLSEAAEVPEGPTNKIDLEAMGPSEVYTALTNEEAPDVLLRAEERMRLRAASGVEPMTTTTEPAFAGAADDQPAVTKVVTPTEAQPAAAPGDTAVVRSALTGGSCNSDWFVKQTWTTSAGIPLPFCPTGQFGGDYTWCMRDWWGGAYATSGNTDRSWGIVCADIGGVTLKVSSGRGGGTWSVPQGAWRGWYSGVSSCGISHWCDFSARYDITDAANSRFNFGGTFQHRD